MRKANILKQKLPRESGNFCFNFLNPMGVTDSPNKKFKFFELNGGSKFT